MLVELSVMEQRYEAVMEVLRMRRSVIEVAVQFGVSRQSLHAWLARYARGGLPALADHSHRPAACPHQMGTDVEVAICEMRRAHPGWGPISITHELRKSGLELLPSRSAVYRALVRNHLIEPRARRRKRSDYVRFERERPMELWQMDVVGGIFLTDGTELKAVTGVDDHSRFCVAATLVRRATARAVCGAFGAAMAAHGVPDEVLTDNGKVFTGRFQRRPTEVLFDQMCRERGITHRLTAPRHPTTTGKVERFHQTLRKEFLATHVLTDLAQAQVALDKWVAEYNACRPHQSLAMASPAERFSAREEPAPPEPPEPVSVRPGRVQRGEVKVTRWVSENGKIHVGGVRMYVGINLAGRLVTVRVEEKLLHVYVSGRLVKTLRRPPSQKEVNHTRARRRSTVARRAG